MTMRVFHLTVLLVLLLLLQRVESRRTERMSVRIRNELPDTLAVHCKSGNDDLHQQYLPAGGTPYYFTFKANFWGSQLFWCRFDHGSLWNSFEVWKGAGFWGTKKQACKQCLWVVRADGFYRGQEGTDLLMAVWPWRDDPRPPQTQNASFIPSHS